MKKPKRDSSFHRLKLLFIGKARDVNDNRIFQHLTLIAFFAWIGLGSDGLSSSCYGPDEAYRFLGEYHRLAMFIGLAIVLTIVIISTSYSQIIKLFPSGGGGYKVATKLLSPGLGMISGCALIVDYVLTIAMSVAAGSDAIFSFLPPFYQQFKIFLALFGVLILIILNLRGIKESVFSLMPIFIIFVAMHAFLILYSFFRHSVMIPELYSDSMIDFRHASQSLGWSGVMILMLRSYSMGAGTYTGLEAVSNSVPILKEPRVRTGLITMRYMAVSLSVMVVGLMFSYTFYKVTPSPFKTMNASLLEAMTAGWGKSWALGFILVTLLSEAALLFIAAQTGFLDGPRVMSSMAGDNWFPRKFAVLSDRLVTQNGILFMGVLALLFLIATKGSVGILVILYSINVFITFALSQAGMVRHWWMERIADKRWIGKLLINGVGLVITIFILAMVIITKFREGGWITLLITSAMIFLVSRIRKHYQRVEKMVIRFNNKMFAQMDEVLAERKSPIPRHPKYDPEGRTAVLCVNGYNGTGIAAFNTILKDFPDYKNFIFLEVGIVDSGNFKGIGELYNLEAQVKEGLYEYRKLAEALGFYAEISYSIGTDVADEIKELSKKIKIKYPEAIFFIGQFILPKTTAFQRMLHNQAQLAIQNRLAHKGFILVMIPVRAYLHLEQ
jgi:amino acid transporter